VEAPPLDSPCDGPVTYPGDIKTLRTPSKGTSGPTQIGSYEEKLQSKFQLLLHRLRPILKWTKWQTRKYERAIIKLFPYFSQFHITQYLIRRRVFTGNANSNLRPHFLSLFYTSCSKKTLPPPPPPPEWSAAHQCTMPWSDGSLPVFQIQTQHGDAVPPTPWYHSGLITAHRGVVPKRVRKIHKITIWSLPLDLVGIGAQNARMAISVTKLKIWKQS
jgi:hypothetical protein